MDQSQEQPYQDLDELSIVVADTTTHSPKSTTSTSTFTTETSATMTATTTTTSMSTFTTSIAAVTGYDTHDTTSTTFISVDGDDEVASSYYPPIPPQVFDEKIEKIVSETKTLVEVVTPPTPPKTPTSSPDPSTLQQELQALSTPKRTFENWARTFRCVPEQYYTPKTEAEIVKVRKRE